MKKLLLLIGLLAATGTQAAEKKPAKTVETYLEMLENCRPALYGWYSWFNSRSNSVVDKAGNVLSIDFSDESTKARLEIGKNSSVLTVEGIDSDRSRATYTFDNRQRIISSDCDLNNFFQDGGNLNYLMTCSYEGDNDFSSSDCYLFRSGYPSQPPVSEPVSMPGIIQTEFGKNEGLVLTYDPALKECTGVQFLGPDGRPRQTSYGYSSFRITYTKFPSDKYSNYGSYSYYDANSAIQQLLPGGIQNLVNDDEGTNFYLSKVEFFDASGKAANTSAGPAQIVVDMQEKDDFDQYALNVNYLDCNGRPTDYKQDSFAFSRIEYIKNDSLTQTSIYTADGALTNNAEGVARHCRIDHEDNQTSYWLDKQGRYVLHEDEEGSTYGFYSQRSGTDESGRYFTYTAYRGADTTQRVNCCNGYSDKYVYYFDNDHDQVQRECYIGADGQPVVNPQTGYAVMECRYLDDGYIFETAYFGGDNKPIEINGIAREVHGYRSKHDTYSPDFKWLYNASGAMIVPGNMPKDPDDASYDSEEEPVVQIVE